jgi:protein-tyrosine phosphatase
MVAAARRLGHDLSRHRAEQVSTQLLDWADTVLAMDGAVLETLRAISSDQQAARLRLYLPDRDVPDPMGQAQEVFNDCAVLIEAATALHLP